MGPDKKGRFYIGNQEQGGLVVFDPSTEQFTILPDLPGGGEMMDVSKSHVDNHGWRSGPGRLPDQSRYLRGDQDHQGVEINARYDIASDTKNNLYGAGRGSTYVWYADAKTGEVSYYDIPATPRGVGGLGGGMRRGKADAQDRLWWGGFDGNFIGMLDPKQPAGKANEAVGHATRGSCRTMPITTSAGIRGLAGSMPTASRGCIVDSGEWNFYLLPFTANIRDIDLKPAAGGGLSGLWIGHTHQAAITLIEPLAK